MCGYEGYDCQDKEDGTCGKKQKPTIFYYKNFS